MRVLLKISGEALAGGEPSGLDYVMLDEVCEKIKELLKKNIQVGVVVGAGNFIRGSEIEKINIDRCNADNMGMLAININAIALGDVLERKGIHVKIMNSFQMDGIAERFNKTKAVKDLKANKVVIFSGGTGNPYFTTDTAGVLRALEIEADLMIKATKVNGVYDKDPIKFNDAVFIPEASYDEVITKNIRVMDHTAIALAKENNLKLKVVSLYDSGAILRAVLGKNEGTLIS
ncbi:MAG: UMP kinase [Candidatus Gracilibacteria bacterium]|nr:UMP kinase [Candidatus Gracilibacteria bacterium]